MKQRTKRKKIKEAQALFIAVGIIFLIHGLSLLLPFAWMMMTSFKGRLDYADSFLGLPARWRFENYTSIFEILKVEVIRGGQLYEYNVFNMLGNSLILATFGSFFGLLSVVLCSYCVAKYDFKLRKLLFNINIFVMVIPIVGSLANTLTVYRQLGIYNNFLLYIILPGGPFGFNFLLLYGAFKAIPNSYSEAVFIDGGGHLTVFLKIIIPIMMPTLCALYILAFIGSWNDYSAQRAHAGVRAVSVPVRFRQIRRESAGSSGGFRHLFHPFGGAVLLLPEGDHEVTYSRRTERINFKERKL